MQWDFESIRNRNLIEVSTNISDTIEGNFETANGVIGKGLPLDGYTTSILREGTAMKNPGGNFTIDTWISLGEYPWSPVIITESDEVKDINAGCYWRTMDILQQCCRNFTPAGVKQIHGVTHFITGVLC